MPRRLSAAVLASLCLLGLPAHAQAEALAMVDQATQAAAATQPGDRRRLADHTFLPNSTYLEAPLVVSSFGLEVGALGGSATGSTYDIHGQPTGETRTYDYGGLGPNIRFQVALGERWAVRGSVGATFLTGLDAPSALVAGITMQVSTSLGAQWSTRLGDRVLLGVALDLDRSPQLNVLVAAAIVRGLETGAIDSTSPLSIAEILTWKPALTAAWVPTPAVGLVGRASYAYSSSTTEAYGTLERQAVVLSFGADLDLQRFWPSVPAGVTLSVVDSIPIKEAVGGLTDLSLGFMYTARPDLVAGLVVGRQVLKVRPEYPDPLKADQGYLTVVGRLYWP